jgi:hypothetical protein
VAIIVLFLMARLLSSQWVMAAVGRWAIIAGLAIFYELRIFKKILPLMRPPEEQPVSGVGLAVKLTFLSGLSYALLAGFLLVTPPEKALMWLPAGLAGLALAADGAAGLVFRRHEQETVGGGHLAREFRALGILLLTVLAIHYSKLPLWMLLIGVMDYLHLFTSSWLGRRGKSIRRPPAQPRRFLQGLYMIAVGVSFWPAISPRYAAVTCLLFGLPYFLIALRDWFILAGILDPDQSHYHQAASAMNRALTGWLALSIRLLAAMAAATVAADMLVRLDVYAKAFSEALYAGAVALMLLAALPFLFLGVRTRLFALIAFIALSIVLLIMGPNTVIFIGILLLGLTLILGAGNLAIEREDAAASPPTDH